MSFLAFGAVRFVPSAHQRMAFADAARAAFFEHEPDCVALELPAALKEWIVRGVMRLPQVSCVCYPSPAEDGEMFYVPIDPCDSMIEAARLAIAAGIEILWLEDEPARRAPVRYSLPDDLTVERAGLEAYAEAVSPFLPPPDADSQNREHAMAARLGAAAAGGRRVLCVLGLAHLAGVRRGLEQISQDPARAPTQVPPGAARPAAGAFLAHVKPDSLSELFAEIPHAAYRRELAREEAGEDPGAQFDKLAALSWIYKRAKRRYRDEFKSEVSVAQMKALHQFARNLAFVRGRFQPDAYELVLGARAAVDGDYGYSVWELARSYPLQSEEAELPLLDLRDGRGSFSDRDEKFRMSSEFGSAPSEKIKLRFRRRPTIQMREEWKESWQKSGWLYGPCSWPPEDERQERFMTFVRKRALETISEDRKQTAEFTTSFLDGLDLRETMRNWHAKKLYVQQTPQPQGKVGAVVVVFEDEAADENFSWRATLYAENQNESDISFYATPLGDRVVGPRISLTEFGGLLSIYPARGIPDIWSMPDAADLPKCSDVLLAAAILFSPDRFIAYVAERPPSGIMRDLAAQFRKHVIHLPIRRFPASQLRRVRRFHILDGKSARSYAADYIFDE